MNGDCLHSSGQYDGLSCLSGISEVRMQQLQLSLTITVSVVAIYLQSESMCEIFLRNRIDLSVTKGFHTVRVTRAFLRSETFTLTLLLKRRLYKVALPFTC